MSLAGQTCHAAALHGNWTAAWERFGWLPEQFDIGMTTSHPVEKVRLARRGRRFPLPPLPPLPSVPWGLRTGDLYP